MIETLIEIKKVTKSFAANEPPAVYQIDASLPKGQIIGLVGPDGAGKTTLIRLMAGLLKPNEGTITIAGYDTIKQPEYIHTFLGYMPQKFGLYEDLTVKQNLNLYSDLHGITREERGPLFDKLLSFTTLAPFIDRLAKNLSGGMKQKLGLACSLICKPRVLLLDEPSVGVDPISRRELWKMIYDLLNQGITVVWSTAYLDEAERCNIVMLLNEGKMLYQGPPGNLTQRVLGRTFKITNIEGSRRAVLMNALNRPNVIDGVIQGSDVRIVSAKHETPPMDITGIDGAHVVNIVETPPRFEDAFVDILGGGPGGTSVLADITPVIEAKKGMIIEAKGLTKKFGSFIAAENITFDIPSGEIFGLLGPNGAGKSTTFKMLCGLLTPTQGKALVNGYDLRTTPGIAQAQLGYMAQKFSLYGDLSVLQNLEFFSGIYNLKGKQQRDIIEEMIEIFNFKQFINHSAGELPLGFKQRLALSCAVMHHPKVLFLDEPTSGVDPLTRREFWNHINGLVEKGVTVLVTTHFMDEAEYCDRIGLVYRSRMIDIGSPDELKKKAQTPDNPFPNLEDAFIKIIENYEAALNEHSAKL